MNRNLEELARARLASGETNEELVGWMHSTGCSIIEAIRVLYRVAGLGLGEAKEVVSCHPAWEEEVVASIPLQEEAIAVATQVAKESRSSRQNK